jgi:hypothetical protein
MISSIPAIFMIAPVLLGLGAVTVSIFARDLTMRQKTISVAADAKP